MGQQYHSRKTRIEFFPGLTKARCAEFLSPHYRRRRQERSHFAALRDSLLSLLFYLFIPFRAVEVCRRLKLEWSSYPALVRDSLRNFFDPNDYLLFEIRSPEQTKTIMRRFELAPIFRRINRFGWTNDCYLNDKKAFYNVCRANQLPYPEVVATLENGQLSVLVDDVNYDIAAKPIADRGGQGFIRFTIPVHLTSRVAIEQYLTQKINSHGIGADYVFQRLIRPHPSIRDIALDALPTIRVTTILNEVDDPEIVTSVLRIPSKAGIFVDNLKAGGIIAAVGEDGKIFRACSGKKLQSYVNHPESGARLLGRDIEQWPEVRDLAIKAHRCCREYNVIGWDIGLSDGGAILIEGNSKPCMIVAQRGMGVGVGASRFGKLIAYHLDGIASS